MRITELNQIPKEVLGTITGHRAMTVTREETPRGQQVAPGVQIQVDHQEIAPHGHLVAAGVQTPVVRIGHPVVLLHRIPVEVQEVAQDLQDHPEDQNREGQDAGNSS